MDLPAPAPRTTAPAEGRDGAPVARPIDLGTALRLATASHHDVLEARAQVREEKGRVEGADGVLWPTLSGGALMGRTNGTVQGSFGDFRDVRYRTAAPAGTLRVSWNLGQVIHARLAAHRSLDAAVSTEAAAGQRVLRTVAEQYLGLVEAAGEEAIREQSAADVLAVARLVESREVGGAGASLDTARARAEVAAAERALLEARNERQRRSKSLAASLRLDPTVDLVPVDTDLAPARLVDPAEPLERWLARVGRGHPGWEALERAGEAAQGEADAARWNLWSPELAATGLAGGAGSSFGNVEGRESWSVFLGWTLSGGAWGRIASAEARAERAALARERFEEEGRAAAASAFREIGLAREELEAAERERRAAEQALGIARARFEGGLLPETDLLLARQAADRARLQRLAAVARHNQAQIRLLGEAGVLSVEALAGGEDPP
jgi:outer membrane protein TolC